MFSYWCLDIVCRTYSGVCPYCTHAGHYSPCKTFGVSQYIIRASRFLYCVPNLLYLHHQGIYDLALNSYSGTPHRHMGPG